MLTHQNTYDNIRGLISNKISAFATRENTVKLSDAKADIMHLDDAWNNYKITELDFIRESSDKTMINLIGNWTRFVRTTWRMEAKYGPAN